MTREDRYEATYGVATRSMLSAKALLQAYTSKLLMSTLHAVSRQRLVHNALTTQQSTIDNTNVNMTSAAGKDRCCSYTFENV